MPKKTSAEDMAKLREAAVAAAMEGDTQTANNLMRLGKTIEQREAEEDDDD